MAGELGISSNECLVIKDSPSGVKAALAAGMLCIVVTTTFTREAIRAETLLPGTHIVDWPDQLSIVAIHIFEQHKT